MAALLWLTAPTVARAQGAAPVSQAAPRGTVRAQATWDDRYLYVVFQVDDPDVLGTNTLPLSEPQKDDSVAVYIQTGTAAGNAPDANTHAMIVSAAGGFTFLAGDAEKKTLQTKPVFSIKYGQTVQGTLNRADDTDKGYLVEMAMPWSELGVDGATLKAGAPFSINLVVRDRTGKSFSSFSPNVKTDADIADPSKWAPLVLAAAESQEVPPGAVLAPPIPIRGGKPSPPLIDGLQKVAGEWPAAGKVTFDAPDHTPPAETAAPTPKPVVTNVEDTLPPALTLNANTLATMEPLIFARYMLDYQGDPRKPAPFQGAVDPQTGRFLLSDQPPTGVGSWFSSDRPSWHRGLLYEIRRSGVDSALIEIGGPNHPTGASDAKALLTLVEALREMTQAGLPTPKISLCLDTARLAPDGGKTDVGTAEGQARLYAAIRRFFAIVPPEYRTRVNLPLAAGGVAAFPIFFSDGTALTNSQGGDVYGALQKEFAKEWGPQTGGATLVFVGGPGFDATASAGLIAGGVPFKEGGAASGALPVFVVQPGKETRDGKLVARKDGETYKQSWEAALAKKTKWFVLDSWNDFTNGTELVATREYGPRYLDLTRIYSVQIGNLEGIDLRWRENDIPRRLRVGQTAPVQVSVQNGGGTTLRPEDGYALSYRWRQGDKVVAEAPLRNRLNSAFLPTQTKSFLLGLSGLMLDGTDKLTPLLPGDYTVEINFLKLADPARLDGTGQYLSDSGVPSLVVPVTLYAEDRPGVQFGTTTTPALLQAGGTYPVTIGVRWTGGDDLASGTAAITWQLLTADGKTLVGTGTTPINQLLPSGVTVPVVANLTLNDTSGLPVPPAFPELPEGRGNPGGGYRLRWILTRSDSTETVPGELTEQVAVYGGDEEAGIPAPPKFPGTVDADSTFPLEITVINRGTQPWKKSEYLVGYHWYFSDGIEAAWKPSITASLPKDLGPGEEATVKLTVRAPEMDGSYILVPDVAKGADDYLSTRPVTRIGDITPLFVRVVGGRLTFVDLTKLFNVDGVAAEAKPGDGDLDEKGGTFPAESFPPDRYGLNAPEERPVQTDDKKAKKPKPLPSPAYPSGYYTDVSLSARRIAFRYGANTDGVKNALACAGQTIPIPKGNYVGLHLAATATGGKTESVPLKLTYADNTTETVTVSIRDWNTAQVLIGDPVAVTTLRKRTAQGDLPMPCVLRHIIAPTNVGKQLVSVTLPDNIAVKIFAMTLDR